jgi:HSP20 family protein
MKIVKINKKPQDSIYTPIRSSLMDDFFSFPLNRWDDFFYRDYENLSADIWEENNNVFVKMALPGIEKKDIKISVTGDSLAIEGESKEEKEEKEKKYYLHTLQTQSYRQSFNLPSTINPDAVEANFKDGILKIKLPKAKESQIKEIEIK